jgi:midasin
MLDYVDWFNVTICEDPNTFCNDFKLSLRDVLSWARFIADVSLKHETVDQYSAYLHGAALMHLDGIGLGTGVSNHDASATRDKAKTYLIQQIAPMCESLEIVGFKDELEELGGSLIDTATIFGINPFTIPKGKNTVPAESQFHMTAPTTGMNLRRVLRGMQISKPILLEGSPGVGKTR